MAPGSARPHTASPHTPPDSWVIMIKERPWIIAQLPISTLHLLSHFCSLWLHLRLLVFPLRITVSNFIHHTHSHIFHQTFLTHFSFLQKLDSLQTVWRILLRLKAPWGRKCQLSQHSLAASWNTKLLFSLLRIITSKCKKKNERKLQ